VSDADTTIYLFGTIHLLPTNYQWRTAKFNQALASSNELMVETIVDLKHPDEILTAKRDLGYSAGLPPIESRVPAAKLPLLRASIAKTGVPEQYFNSMESWLAAFELLGVRFQEMVSSRPTPNSSASSTACPRPPSACCSKARSMRPRAWTPTFQRCSPRGRAAT
jgi:uncharacterized protein YbaP (TraB family)